MSGAEDAEAFDEFDFIAEVLRPLTRGAPEALDLLDDAAVIPSRPGRDLVVTADALVEGVHFLPDDPLDLVARKLLRVNLSDLAAKGAEPYGYFLTTCWPERVSLSARRRFAGGLQVDGEAYGLRLFGGDTTSTPGPLTLSLTLLGWTPQGRAVRRSGARPGDRVMVSGAIGDGWLGLLAATGRLSAAREDLVFLADGYRLPQPRTELSAALLQGAHAAADVSDGLLADAGNIARASGVGMVLDLERLPTSAAGARWLASERDRARGLVQLATGGDDYEIVCTVPDDAVIALQTAAAAVDLPLTDIGAVVEGQGVQARFEGQELRPARTGWRHG
jgi:thiamine-monophosphate kinase